MAAPQVQDASARRSRPVRVKARCQRLGARVTFARDAIAVHADTFRSEAIIRKRHALICLAMPDLQGGSRQRR